MVDKYSIDTILNYFEPTLFDYDTDSLFIKEKQITFQKNEDRKEFMNKLKENRKQIIKHIIETFQNEYQLIEIPENSNEKEYKGFLKWVYSIFIRNN